MMGKRSFRLLPIIARGVQLAQQHRHPFLAAKGQRHLAAVALNKKDAARAITLLDDGEAFISALTNYRQRCATCPTASPSILGRKRATSFSGCRAKQKRRGACDYAIG